jgi:hypothetical protein
MKGQKQIPLLCREGQGEVETFGESPPNLKSQNNQQLKEA